MPWIITLASRRKKAGPGRGPDGILLVLRNGDSDTMNILLCQLLDPRIDPIDDFTDAFRPDTIRLLMEFVETSGNHLQRHVLVQRYVYASRDLFVPFSRKHSTTQHKGKDNSFTLFPPLSIARYSHIQLSELGHCGENENT